MPRDARLKRTLIATAIGIVVVGLVLVALHRRGFVRLNEPSRTTYPVRGIDVSSHQGEIEWETAIDQGGISFAFIKASEGASFRDRRFGANWREAESIARGAYHFFTFCSDGRAQAENFLRAAPAPSELPPAVDIEFSGNCTSWTSIVEIRTELEEFLTLVRMEHGRLPVLYVNRDSYSRIVRGHFDSYPLWVREVVVHPPADLYPDWAFWQYAGNGRMAGISTLVDLNVFAGSAEELQALRIDGH